MTDWLVFGLGNPGERYRRTRHNLGWRLLDQLAERLSVRFDAGRGDYFAGCGDDRGHRIHLIKPTTYMNLSGRAVRQYLAIERPEAPQILIAIDDVALPLGRIRFRPRGSTGGHNGLESVEATLETSDYGRVRMGVGLLPEDRELVEFVLEEFDDEDLEAVDRMIDRAADGVLSWIHEGPEITMGRFNG